MKIIYSELAHKKIMYWVNKCDKEVSGFSTVQYIPASKTFYVKDSFLLEQEVGSAHTDIDAKSLGKLLYKTRDQRAENFELRLWWHSHVNMSVFWSGTDRATIEDLGKNGWIVATVFNKKNEWHSAVCVKTSSDLGSDVTFYDAIKTELENKIDQSFVEACDKEFLENVKEKTWSTWQSHIDQGPFMSRHYDNNDYVSNFNTKSEKNYYKQRGILGYGSKKEAEALKLTEKEYLKMIIHGTDKDFELLEQKLMTLEQARVL